jgi:hypothetical protein
VTAEDIGEEFMKAKARAKAARPKDFAAGVGDSQSFVGTSDLRTVGSDQLAMSHSDFASHDIFNGA